MNDLVSLQNRAMAAIKKFQEIESFEDLKMWLLQGRGMSPETYNSYLESIKQFYKLFDGLHPLQWTPAHIEEFYDVIRAKNSIRTAQIRISGIKRVCKNIKEIMPFWDDPFDVMPERVKSKLKAGERGKKKIALYKTELHAVLHHLKQDETLKGKQNLAMILTLVTTGLRAAELCNLTYDDLEHDPDLDIWYLKGVGKGNKPFHVEVHPDAVESAAAAFKARFKREWKQGDFLFWSLENYHGKPPVRMNKSVLWIRLRDITKDLILNNVINKNIKINGSFLRRVYKNNGYRYVDIFK